MNKQFIENIKKQYEKREEENLSEFACKSSNTLGREIPIEECFLRTVFQRDRDRIIHSKAFRRLKHKTQVFLSSFGDHYRTRLTHTLEVSQISRTIARALRLNEDLTEAIALGHDLGHTPFGHTGEEVLNGLLPWGFKHNQQSIRVVTVLENLNLTKETLNGIEHHTGEIQPFTLEGQVVKISDRIAYLNHDVDDALRAGVINIEDIPKSCKEYFGSAKGESITKMVCDIIENSWEKDIILMSNECLEQMNIFRDWMFNNVYIGSKAKVEEQKAKKIIVELFDYYLNLLKENCHGDFCEENILKQTVSDYIAGMTDRYALKKYKKIYLPSMHQETVNDNFLFTLLEENRKLQRKMNEQQ